MRGGRVLLLAVALACATPGCASEGSDRSDLGGPPAEATRVRAAGAVPVQSWVRPMDGAMVGLRMGAYDEPDDVTVSVDGGRTWRAASLPDRPAELDLSYPGHGLHVDRDVVVVAGRDAAWAVPGQLVAKSEVRLWTSPDGVTWSGHVLATAGGTVSDPAVAEVGSVLVAWVGSQEGFNLYVSGDRGVSWQRAEVAGLTGGEHAMVEAAPEAGGSLRFVLVGSSRSDGQLLTSDDDGATWQAEPCGERCPYPPSTDTITRRPQGYTVDEDERARQAEYSLDDGETWHQLAFDPPPPDDTKGPPSLSTAVEVPGGWLATARSSNGSDSHMVSYGHVLRSDDGRSWTQLLPTDACPGTAPEDDPDESSVTEPVQLAGRWYVAFSCWSSPASAEIYSSDGRAEVFRPVQGTRREGVVFGEPILDGDRLLFPEANIRDALAGITVLE